MSLFFPSGFLDKNNDLLYRNIKDVSPSNATWSEFGFISKVWLQCKYIFYLGDEAIKKSHNPAVFSCKWTRQQEKTRNGTIKNMCLANMLKSLNSQDL